MPVMDGLMSDLVSAIPKIIGYFAATTSPVFNSDVPRTIYAVARYWKP